MRTVVAIALTLAACLPSCVPTVRPESVTPTTAAWRTKTFQVTFRAGPRDERFYSTYQITRTAADGNIDEIVMESAHSVRGFQCVTDSKPGNWIRITEDPSGDALLIEEEIPNDCAPCSNYLWVHYDREGILRGTYLALPSASNGSDGGIDYEYPKIKSLKGRTLTYAYSDGKTVRKDIREIGKADAPTPPG